MSPEEADRRCYLSKDMLDLMHLAPVGQPVACSGEGDGLILYYEPARVTEAAPELWYKPMMEEHEPVDVIELESGAEVEKLSTKRAAAMGFYTRERLDQMNFDVVEEPVAYNLRSDGTMIYFYDKRTAVRRPLKCTVCGKDVRYKRKMCRACFEKDLAIRRVEGDAHREKEYGMVLRAKGIVECKCGSWLHFDYVPGEPDIREGSAGIIGRLCVIGAGLDEDKIKALFGI
jgi:hypothetical protein